MADRLLRPRPLRPTTGPRPLTAVRRPAVAVPAGFHNPLAPVTPASPPTLLPIIGTEDDIDPALERLLAEVARRAQSGDWAARDALYAAFEPKLSRFVRRIRVPFMPAGCVGLWERDDVQQEAWLVFAGIVASWPEDVLFGRYVLANFPWRLRDAIHRGVAKRSVPPRSFGVRAGAGIEIADGKAVDAEQCALIEALAESLGPPLADVVRLHVIERMSLIDVARQMGVGERSVSRYWRSARARLREASPAR